MLILAIMSAGLASLHKVLKDETRRKITLFLRNKGSLSYTDLMKALGIDSTGKLNYHLKILDNLILKREDGQYVLTEKGELALRLMLAYPEDNGQQSGKKPKWWRRFWIEMAIGTVALLIITLAAYFLGYLDLDGVYQGIISIISGIGVAYMIQHILRDVLSKKRQLMIAKIAYTGLGAWAGWAITFFGAVLISALFRLSGNLPPLANPNGWWFLVLAFVIAPIIGAPIGYWVGKRRHFRTPNYIPDS